jgi:hypothetical protein
MSEVTLKVPAEHVEIFRFEVLCLMEGCAEAVQVGVRHFGRGEQHGDSLAELQMDRARFAAVSDLLDRIGFDEPLGELELRSVSPELLEQLIDGVLAYLGDQVHGLAEEPERPEAIRAAMEKIEWFLRLREQLVSVKVAS